MRIWERAKQKLVDKREDRGVGADADREGEHDGKGHSRASANSTNGEPAIANQILDETRAADVVPLLLQTKDAAETDPRQAICLGLARASGHVLAFQRLDMKGHLLFHVAIAGVP